MISFDQPGMALWTTAQAAQAAGVNPGTVRQWVFRGHLQQAAGQTGTPLFDERNRPLYWAADVAKAELATRKKARRTEPSTS